MSSVNKERLYFESLDTASLASVAELNQDAVERIDNKLRSLKDTHEKSKIATLRELRRKHKDLHTLAVAILKKRQLRLF